MLIDFISWALLLLGSFLAVTGAWGLIRFPDFYSRVHAASITDTLCTACFVVGLMLQAGFYLVAVKLVMILWLLWLTGPAATHALVRAAYTAGLKPHSVNKDT